jgi:hypothetical protein
MNASSVSRTSSNSTIESVNSVPSTVRNGNLYQQEQQIQNKLNKEFTKNNQIRPNVFEQMIDEPARAISLKEKLLKMLCCNQN